MNFSVIIPTQNRKRLLSKLLQSINDNHFNGKLDVIVVDSSFGIRPYTRALPYVFTNRSFTLKIFSAEDRGPSVARNTGISKAKWRHLIFVDDDCVLSENFFQTYQLLWKQYPKARIIGGKVLPMTEGEFTQKQLRFMNDYYGSFGVTALGETDRLLHPGELVYTANMSYRLSHQREKALFDERLGRKMTDAIIIYAEDYELCGRVLLNGEPVIYSPRAVAYNHISSNRFTTDYLNRHASISGMEQALMERILNDKFNGAYEKRSIVNIYKNALLNILRGKEIRVGAELFNSRLKLRFAFSYLLNKYYLFR